MSRSSPKRRRLSDDAHDNDQQPRQFPKSAPTTPRRASYLSPTKSSLQRSHPHLVQRSTRQSAQLEGHRLLQHVLGGAPTDELQLPQVRTQSDGEALELSVGAKIYGHPNNIDVTEFLPSRSQTRSSLQRRKQHTRTSSKQVENGRSPGYTMLPRVVKSSQSRRRQFSLSPDDGNHALPPTPVQLGRDLPPERPRGLASSSPRVSRSGSGRKRNAQKDDYSVHSSPLKPKSRMSPAQKRAQLERQVQLAGDSPESDVNEGDIEHDSPVQEQPAVIKEKETLLKDLQSSTRKLLSHTRDLEKAITHNDVFKTLDRDNMWKDVVRNTGMTRTLQEPLFDKKLAPPSPGRQALHLNLFAPGGLQLRSSTRTAIDGDHTAIDGDHTAVIHTVRVACPPPWPPHILNLSFEVTTHPEDLTVDSITFSTGSGKHNLSRELHQWIIRRLANDVVRTDLAGLVWGVGKHFEAAIHRARAFYALKQKHADDGDTSQDLKSVTSGTITIDQALALAPYMSTSSLVLSSPGTDETPSTSKLLASWQICLTPTSEVRHECEIVLSGVSEAMGIAAAELFETLWRLEGFERSVDAVMDLLRGEDEGQFTAPLQKRKRKKFA